MDIIMIHRPRFFSFFLEHRLRRTVFLLIVLLTSVVNLLYHSPFFKLDVSPTIIRLYLSLCLFLALHPPPPHNTPELFVAHVYRLLRYIVYLIHIRRW